MPEFPVRISCFFRLIQEIMCIVFVFFFRVSREWCPDHREIPMKNPYLSVTTPSGTFPSKLEVLGKQLDFTLAVLVPSTQIGILKVETR